jgi:hypothetical protein
MILERETGFEPATSSLGIQTYFESKSLARFCCEFLNLQHLAESAFSRLDHPNEAQTRHVLPHVGDVLKASSALNDSWPKSKQMTRRQCRPIPADGTAAPPQSADPNGPGAARRRRGKYDEYGQTNPEDGGPFMPAAQTESSRQLIERIVAGRRRVREYHEAHGLNQQWNHFSTPSAPTRSLSGKRSHNGH